MSKSKLIFFWIASLTNILSTTLRHHHVQKFNTLKNKHVYHTEFVSSYVCVDLPHVGQFQSWRKPMHEKNVASNTTDMAKKKIFEFSAIFFVPTFNATYN